MIHVGRVVFFHIFVFSFCRHNSSPIAHAQELVGFLMLSFSETSKFCQAWFPKSYQPGYAWHNPEGKDFEIWGNQVKGFFSIFSVSPLTKHTKLELVFHFFLNDFGGTGLVQVQLDSSTHHSMANPERRRSWVRLFCFAHVVAILIFDSHSGKVDFQSRITLE